MTETDNDANGAHARWMSGPTQIQIEGIRELERQRWEDHQNIHSFADGALKERAEGAQTAITTALTAQEKAVNAALQAAKEAVLKAEVAAEKRFESVNEFRNTLSDQQRTLMPRSEVDVRLLAIGDRLAAIEKKQERTGGRDSGIHIVWLAVLAIAAILISLVNAGIGLFR